MRRRQRLELLLARRKLRLALGQRGDEVLVGQPSSLRGQLVALGRGGPEPRDLLLAERPLAHLLPERAPELRRLDDALLERALEARHLGLADLELRAAGREAPAEPRG